MTKNPAARTSAAAVQRSDQDPGRGLVRALAQGRGGFPVELQQHSAPAPATQAADHARKSSSAVVTAVVRNSRKPMRRIWRRWGSLRGKARRTPQSRNSRFDHGEQDPRRAAPAAGRPGQGRELQDAPPAVQGPAAPLDQGRGQQGQGHGAPVPRGRRRPVEASAPQASQGGRWSSQRPAFTRAPSCPAPPPGRPRSPGQGARHPRRRGGAQQGPANRLPGPRGEGQVIFQGQAGQALGQFPAHPAVPGAAPGQEQGSAGGQRRTPGAAAPGPPPRR